MKILVVDDCGNTGIVLKTFLEEDGYNVEILTSAKKALEIIEHKESQPKFDLILMDFMLPEMDGIEACKKIKDIDVYIDIPVLIITVQNEISCLQRAFDAGAVDYISKPVNKIELTARVRSALRLKEQIEFRKKREKELLKITRKLKKSNQKLRQLSVLDELTNINNRRSFEQSFLMEWRRGQRNNNKISLLFVDVDCFKAYNDNYGHPQGDECLKQIAKALNSSVNRSGDVVARYGGEEFVILLPATDEDGAYVVAQNLQTKIKSKKISHGFSSASDKVTISIGIATTLPDQESSPMTLLIHADKALYEAKKRGRNQIVVFGKII